MSSGVSFSTFRRKRHLAVGHVVMQMHDAFWPAGRAGRIHPERHLVAVGASLRQIGREAAQPGVGDDCGRHGVFAGGAVDHDQRVERRVLAGLGIEAGAEFGIGNGDRGAGVGEIELQQVRRRQRVDQQRHKTCAHRAEERRRIGRGVVEEQQDAVAARQAQRGKAVAPSRSIGAKLAVGARPRRAGQRHPVAATCGQVVEQDAAAIVMLGNRKADLARGRTILRNLIGDLGHDFLLDAS